MQPLLRGSGLDVNNAPTELAELDTKIAQYELVRQLENHLLEVERAYWALYTARANLFLSRHLAGHGRRLVQQAAARQEVDGDPTLASARARPPAAGRPALSGPRARSTTRSSASARSPTRPS